MKIYQVDAFNNAVFKGNPAAVIPLQEWISDDLMQQIAEENNLSETVFFLPNGKAFDIRWFTPVDEIDLCGHATLAAAHILYMELGYSQKTLIFNSKSGELTVTKENDWYTLNFPSELTNEIKIPDNLERVLGTKVKKCSQGKWKLLVELTNEAAVRNLNPDFGMMRTLEYNGIIVTAKGNTVDFVSRFFAPKIGIDEDPVTGSAHTLLIPYWAKALNQSQLDAIQCSSREGILKCMYLDDRVEMSGQAVTYMIGNLTLN